jgi:hypothetical protein
LIKAIKCHPGFFSALNDTWALLNLAAGQRWQRQRISFGVFSQKTSKQAACEKSVVSGSVRASRVITWSAEAGDPRLIACDVPLFFAALVRKRTDPVEVAHRKSHKDTGQPSCHGMA